MSDFKNGFIPNDFSAKDFLKEDKNILLENTEKIVFSVDSDWLMNNFDKISKFGKVDEWEIDPFFYAIDIKKSQKNQFLSQFKSKLNIEKII
jgi:hypothetical protein